MKILIFTIILLGAIPGIGASLILSKIEIDQYKMERDRSGVLIPGIQLSFKEAHAGFNLYNNKTTLLLILIGTVLYIIGFTSLFFIPFKE